MAFTRSTDSKTSRPMGAIKPRYGEGQVGTGAGGVIHLKNRIHQLSNAFDGVLRKKKVRKVASLRLEIGLPGPFCNSTCGEDGGGVSESAPERLAPRG